LLIAWWRNTVRRIIKTMPTLLNRLIRAAGLAAAVVIIGTALVLGWDWLKVIAPPRLYPRYLAIALLETFLASYFVIVTLVTLGVVVSATVVWRSSTRLRPGRWLLLCGSIVLGLIVAEGAASVWRFEVHRLPALPGRFAQVSRPVDEILIVVAGESSALGVPYDGWLSVGAIVGCELQKVLPSRRVRVENLAEKGATLEAMHHKLSRLAERPDALVIFCGHNEFLNRFSLANRVVYYSDERSHWGRQLWLERAGRFSPLYTLVRENLEKHRVSVIPALLINTMDTIVGRPVCTQEEASAIMEDFHRRLEAIVTDCERIGCLPILIIPPGNDASAPNQSYASPETAIATRRALAQHLLKILTIEAQNPDRAIAAYQQIIAEQPTHAWTHYRLARLLDLAGSFAEANDHYILARDHDGLPLRGVSLLETIYRSVGRRHPQSILVDGPAVLRSKSRHGILDANLFHDNVHPTVVGYTALAEGVLGSLKSRAAFGWPASTPAPALDPKRCADQFGLDAAAWATICERSAVFYGQIAFLSSDFVDRVQWRDRYALAARQIRAGARPEDVGIPAVGVSLTDTSR
jgi:hypothetical protein